MTCVTRDDLLGQTIAFWRSHPVSASVFSTGAIYGSGKLAKVNLHRCSQIDLAFAISDGFVVAVSAPRPLAAHSTSGFVRLKCLSIPTIDSSH